MTSILSYKRSTLLISFLIICFLAGTKCINNEQGEPEVIDDAAYKEFAGSATCSTCHKDIYNKHTGTAHYLTSQPARKEYIKGSFEAGKNVYAYNASVAVAMEKRADSFFQVEYYRDIEKKYRRFDIVIGSGIMGQSFLNWRDHYLFQLPITYFTAADSWSNSPGFPDKVVFNRLITSRCLECHSTYAKVLSAPDKEPEQFDHQQIIYGVDCEKCHGPAAKHVEFQTQHPGEVVSKYIINPARLTRQQNLDFCASCHGGRLKKLKPSFTFQIGDALSAYYTPNTAGPHPDSIDVHSNQYGLLGKSTCFKMSKMTCTTCHNTHENERGKTALFSQRCITCHKSVHDNFSTVGDKPVSSIKNNCIDCHMPLKSSKAIAVFLPGSSTATAALIRSHFIDVYREETKKILAYIKKQQIFVTNFRKL